MIDKQENLKMEAVTTAHPRYQFIEDLLNLAFPRQDRRDDARQRHETDHNPLFTPYLISENGQEIGLLTLWRFPGFTYAEHLATLPSLRGKGLGQRVMEKLINDSSLPIVLEVEPPTDELKQRRIGFYQRCGFMLWEHRTYMQPPYSAQLPSIPLRLMVHGQLSEEQDFDHVCREIYTNVYGCTAEEAGHYLKQE